MTKTKIKSNHKIITKNSEQFVFTEDFHNMVQKLVDLIGFEGNTSWICSFHYQDSMLPSLIMTGSGSVIGCFHSIKIKEIYINPSNNPITKITNDLVVFDLSSMRKLSFKDLDPDRNLDNLPSYEDIKQFIENSNKVVEKIHNKENLIKQCVKNFLIGMCGFNIKQAEEASINYLTKLNEEDIRSYPETEHAAMFRIASDWGRRKNLFQS